MSSNSYPSLPLAGGTLKGALTVMGTLTAQAPAQFNGTLTAQGAAQFNGTVASANAVGAPNTAKAWVSFTHLAVNNAFNVSSVTDNATGDYTINFITPFPNTNYVMTSACDSPNGRTNAANFKDGGILAGSARIISVEFNGTSFVAVDLNLATLAFYWG